jgi:hypothetical protein
VLHTIYIIDGGTCLYSYSFVPEPAVDQYLLSGFLSAVGSFAQVAFQTSLQTIALKNRQKVIFHVNDQEMLTTCAICDERDDNRLLEKLVAALTTRFIERMGSVLHTSSRAMVSAYTVFDDDMRAWRFAVKERGPKSVAAGLVLGIALMLGFAAATNPLTARLMLNEDENLAWVLFLSMLCVQFTLCGLTAGFFAGTRRYGGWAGVAFFALLCLLLTMSWDLFTGFLIIAPYVLVVAVAGGYGGGLIADRRLLYPLPGTPTE